MPPRGLRPVGIALVDKQPGPSSFAVVAALRRRTRARTGHAGTLDPFASGLLVLLSGAATRLAPCVVGLDTRYLTDSDLTATTTTGDPEGDVAERHPAPTQAELDAAVERLRGRIELQIPAASAEKIAGQRAYRLARSGVVIEMPTRRSDVHELTVEAYDGTTVRLSLHVSSGTYVRSLAQSLGGHCTTLRRTAVGPFSVEEADHDVATARLLDVEAVLARLPAEALERVPAPVRNGVLAAAASGGAGAA